MVDAYAYIGKKFIPSPADIHSFLDILDRDGDGKLGIQDLEIYSS